MVQQIYVRKNPRRGQVERNPIRSQTRINQEEAHMSKDENGNVKSITPKLPVHGGLDGAERMRLKPAPEPKQEPTKDDKK
jgi:hypothetical protein